MSSPLLTNPSLLLLISKGLQEKIRTPSAPYIPTFSVCAAPLRILAKMATHRVVLAVVPVWGQRYTFTISEILMATALLSGRQPDKMRMVESSQESRYCVYYI